MLECCKRFFICARISIRHHPLRNACRPEYAFYVNFEWDETKNYQNLHKHGMDFDDVWEVFEGPLLVALDSRTDYGEDRLTGIGLLGSRIVVVTFTILDAQTRRIISLRKASKHERKRLEKEIKNGLGAD
jgi:uncharacterized DUF497 family protein